MANRFILQKRGGVRFRPSRAAAPQRPPSFQFARWQAARISWGILSSRVGLVMFAGSGSHPSGGADSNAPADDRITPRAT
jgi:hypothetical protein